MDGRGYGIAAAGDEGSPESGEGVRLQKVMAAAGVGSRRYCERLIEQGKVWVNGRVVTELGTRVDPATAVIDVKGERITTVESGKEYWALNKPLGYVSAMADPQGRPTVADLLPETSSRLFHVGRLDVDTEGLLLLTNDGELAHRLMHPSYNVPKVYLADVPGPLPRDLARRLHKGIELEDGPVRVDAFRIVDTTPTRALVEITLHEGRNHIVRRLMDTVGHPVRRLARTGIGPVKLGDLKGGTVRRLRPHEVSELMRLLEM